MIANHLARPIGGGNSIRSSRAFGLDLVRAFAIFSVIAGHFFSLHTAFRTTPMTGISMTIQSVAQSVFAAGVPLFIMLTGYLNINKTLSRKYYSGIWRVLIAYVFFCIVTLLFRHFFAGDPVSIFTAIKKILDFSAFMYGWYIEMWIGLFLLVPFINILYKGIETRRHKMIFIIILSFITFLPTFTNRYGQHLLPEFWRDCYPLTYYIIGAYIREYTPRISRWLLLSVILAIGIIPPVFSMIVMPGHTQISILGDCFGIFGALSAIAIFLMMYDLKCDNPIVTNSIYWISLLSLDMYLCCYIFDSMIYPWFKSHYFVDQASFGIYFFIIVPIIFVGSFALSLVKRMLFSAPGLVRYR